MKRSEVVSNIRTIIYNEAPHAKVILYGSEARGESKKNSDIDILVIVDKAKITLEDEQKITFSIYMLEIKTGVQISTLIVSKREWENRPFKTPFYINVLNEGIEL